MNMTVKKIIKFVEDDIKYWKNNLKNNSKEKESKEKRLYKSIYEYKLKITKETLNYLNTLDKDSIIRTDTGTTAIGEKYYKMINR